MKRNHSFKIQQQPSQLSKTFKVDSLTDVVLCAYSAYMVVSGRNVSCKNSIQQMIV